MAEMTPSGAFPWPPKASPRRSGVRWRVRLGTGLGYAGGAASA